MEALVSGGGETGAKEWGGEEAKVEVGTPCQWSHALCALGAPNAKTGPA